MSSSGKWSFGENKKYRKLARHLAENDVLVDKEPFFELKDKERLLDWGYSLFLVGFSSYIFHSFLQIQSEKQANEWISSGTAHFVPSPFNVIGLDEEQTFLGLNLKPELAGKEDLLQPDQKFYSFVGNPNHTQLEPYFYFHYAINRSMNAFEDVKEFSDVLEIFLEERDAQVMAEMVGTNYGELVNLSPRLFEPYFGGQIEDSFKLTSELLDSFFTLYGHLKSGYKVHIPNTELEGDPFNSYELDGVIFDPSEKKLIVLETTFNSNIGHLDNKLATYMAFRNTDINKFEYLLIHFNDLSGSQAKESTHRQALMDESFHVIKPEPSLTEVQNAYLTGDKIRNYNELQNSFQQTFEDVIEQLDSTLEQVAG